MSKHIAILGAGPGGYVAAIRAAQLDARVTVVESQALRRMRREGPFIRFEGEPTHDRFVAD